MARYVLVLSGSLFSALRDMPTWLVSLTTSKDGRDGRSELRV